MVTWNYSANKPVGKPLTGLWKIVDKSGLAAGKRGYPQSLNMFFCVLHHRLAFNRLHQDEQVVVEPGVLGAQIDDGAASVHDGGVIATAKGVADFRKAV